MMPLRAPKEDRATDSGMIQLRFWPSTSAPQSFQQKRAIKERKTERERERERDRQTDRQRAREREREPRTAA